MSHLYKYRKLLTVTFFLFIFIIFLHPVGGDGDYYHHLNAGRNIVTSLRLSRLDIFTFTASGRAWMNHSWLGGVTFYLLDNAFGALGVSVLVSLMAVLTLILLTLWLKSYKLPNSTILPLTLLIATALSTRWPSRPEIFAYPFAISILLIDRLRLERPKLVYLYPLIILLWANLYGIGVLMGVALVILIMIKQFLIDHFKIPRPQWLFYILGSVAIPLSLSNGYGFENLFRFFRITNINQTELEWYGTFKILANAPYSYLLTFQYRFLIYLIFLGLLVFAVNIGFKKIKAHFFDALLALSAFAPFFAFRQFPLAAVLSAPFIGILLSLHAKRARKKLAVISLTGAAVLATLTALWVNPPSFIKPDQYPLSLVTFMKEYDLSGNVLNHPQDGGFLSYYLYPDIQIFADTRDDLYLGTDILTNYYQGVAGKKLSELADKYKVDIIVGDLSQGDTYKEFFYSTSWAPVYIGSRYFVAIPASVAIAKKIPTLDFVDPFSPSQAKEGQEEKALDYYRTLAQGNEASVDDQLRLANILFFLKKYDEATVVLSKIKAPQNPGNVLFNMSKDYLTALSYLGKGDCIKSKEYLDQIDQGLKGIMLFTPSKKMPPLKERGYQFYNKACAPPELRLF